MGGWGLFIRHYAHQAINIRNIPTCIVVGEYPIMEVIGAKYVDNMKYARYDTNRQLHCYYLIQLEKRKMFLKITA